MPGSKWAGVYQLHEIAAGTVVEPNYVSVRGSFDPDNDMAIVPVMRGARETSGFIFFCDTIPLALAGNVAAASAFTFNCDKRRQCHCRNWSPLIIGICRL